MIKISRADAKAAGFKSYFTGKPCKHGHISKRSTVNGTCYICAKIIREKIIERDIHAHREKKRKSASRSREKANLEKLKPENIAKAQKIKDEKSAKSALAVKAYKSEWSAKNSKKVKKHKSEWYERNKESISERNKRLRKECPEWRENKNASDLKYYRSNPEAFFVRNTLKRILSNWKGGRKKYEALLGYTVKELRTHIQDSFATGMSWDNYGDWHIDHIKPISLFISEGVKDPAVINALSNLQPLWALDNIKKGAKYVQPRAN